MWLRKISTHQRGLHKNEKHKKNNLNSDRNIGNKQKTNRNRKKDVNENKCKKININVKQRKREMRKKIGLSEEKQKVELKFDSQAARENESL